MTSRSLLLPLVCAGALLTASAASAATAHATTATGAQARAAKIIEKLYSSEAKLTVTQAKAGESTAVSQMSPCLIQEYDALMAIYTANAGTSGSSKAATAAAQIADDILREGVVQYQVVSSKPDLRATETADTALLQVNLPAKQRARVKAQAGSLTELFGLNSCQVGKAAVTAINSGDYSTAPKGYGSFTKAWQNLESSFDMSELVDGTLGKQVAAAEKQSNKQSAAVRHQLADAKYRWIVTLAAQIS